MVVPDGHDKDMAISEGRAHTGKTTLGGEIVLVTESSLLISAEVVRNAVVSIKSINGSSRVGDDLAVLDIDTTDLRESSGGGVVGGDELGDNGEDRSSVDGRTRAVEVSDTHAERVEVTTILVAHTAVPVVTVTTVGTLATVLAVGGADVGGIGSRNGVGLPDIHLRAARTVGTSSCVRVVVRRLPALDVSLEAKL